MGDSGGCFSSQGIGILLMGVMNIGGGLDGTEELGDGAWFNKGRELDKRETGGVEGMKSWTGMGGMESPSWGSMLFICETKL